MRTNRKSHAYLLATLVTLSSVMAVQAQSVKIQENGQTVTIKNGAKGSSITTSDTRTGKQSRLSSGQSGNRISGKDGTISGGGRDNISVTKSGLQLTYTLNGEVLTINGNQNDVLIRGNCGQLSVSGNANVIHVESAGGITTTGNQNRVLYRSGNPTVSDPGNGNSVTRER